MSRESWSPRMKRRTDIGGLSSIRAGGPVASQHVSHLQRSNHPEPPMAKMIKKADLPTKTCEVCRRPFAWRKKWRRDWESVKYCSDRCRAAAKLRP